ncbi:unnamed protein product [Spirodela intermedia]|uniref:Uncharacterized protein n=1 Tax=Spirodela intermedia TaxID=51605 RepID=A0A7I8IJM9_SPIIN|nr:unnamed protein product [Spirodela intermedia]CAA6658095.1 unnamed protein product [Spirodela intermedia]
MKLPDTRAHLHPAPLRRVTAAGEPQVAVFPLCRVTATSREDLEIAHVVFVQGEPSRPWTLHDDPPERSGFRCIADASPTLFLPDSCLPGADVI